MASVNAAKAATKHLKKHWVRFEVKLNHVYFPDDSLCAILIRFKEPSEKLKILQF